MNCVRLKPLIIQPPFDVSRIQLAELRRENALLHHSIRQYNELRFFVRAALQDLRHSTVPGGLVGLCVGEYERNNVRKQRPVAQVRAVNVKHILHKKHSKRLRIFFQTRFARADRGIRRFRAIWRRVER